VGQSIREHLKLDDQLFTLKLTPNLAHCLSVYGIAREVAALTGAPLKAPVYPTLAPHIRQAAGAGAGARPVRPLHRAHRAGINPQAPTPAWMVERLARCGQRSVSALVDISNYVMFELGRPSHIFDLDKIHGGLQVRWGRAGEQLKLLNGNTVTVDETVGVIADDQAVESLAGIMGGDATAVGDDTRNVFVEAAFWWPKAIAGRSRRYNFSTDAGHRFERGVDPQLTVEHVERITDLILQICGGQAGPIDDHIVNLPEAQPVTLRVARAVKVIGMPLTQQQCADALRRLSLPVSEGEGTVTVTPPSFRFDLQIEEDLIEEVARVIGYDHLPHTPPLAPVTAKSAPRTARAVPVAPPAGPAGLPGNHQLQLCGRALGARLRRQCRPDPPAQPDCQPDERDAFSLLGSLLAVLKFNTDRKAHRVRVFELGRVFTKDASVADSDTTVAGFAQPMRVAGVAYRRRCHPAVGHLCPPGGFFRCEGRCRGPAGTARAHFRARHPPRHAPRPLRPCVLDGQAIGFVGELHPRWRQPKAGSRPR
jgi:phenylalanyl-tRNA synthetase beta chain